MRRLGLILCLAAAMVSCKSKVVTIESLLDEMTDRTAITYLRDYSLKQASSYDRATVAKGDDSWFANWDRSQFIRIEPQADSISEYVMLDEKGPGAIVRFWMTFAGPDCGLGMLKIYIDGELTVEGPAFDVLSGGLLVPAPLSASVSELTDYSMRGHNLYFPIPYSKSCKVTYKSANIFTMGAKTAKDESVYYNIGFRTYPEGTKVESFSKEALDKAQGKIYKTNKKLTALDRDLDNLKIKTYELPRKIEKGGSAEIELKDGAAIRELCIATKEKNRSEVLRRLVLAITFDGEQTVWVPVGDFFGTGYKLCEVSNWYSSVALDGTMKSWWVMPFRTDCKISLVNLSAEDIELETAYAKTADYKFTEQSLHFGAAWRQYSRIQTGVFKSMSGKGGAFDLNYISLKGSGVYAGDGVVLFNTEEAWWGEGDEKIYVDGEDFPSSIGTGTEDYYGYAWCRPEVFTGHPFISQPCGDGSFFPGYTANLRYRALDAIPFSKSLVFDMEMWHWVSAVINFAPVSYWYISPGSSIELEPDYDGVAEKLVFERSDLI